MSGYTEREVEIVILKLVCKSFDLYSDEDVSTLAQETSVDDERIAVVLRHKGIEVLEGLEYFKYRCDVMVQQLVESERSAGRTWSEIGTALGISRQAAQQKFSSLSHGQRDDLKVLSPTTRGNEVSLLRQAALKGWIPWRSYHGYHLLRPTRLGQCELHRKLVLHTAPKESEEWTVATVRFPDVFLFRKLTPERNDLCQITTES